MKRARFKHILCNDKWWLVFVSSDGTEHWLHAVANRGDCFR